MALEARVTVDTAKFKEVVIQIGDARLHLNASEDASWALYWSYPTPDIGATRTNLPITTGRIPAERR
jgi:hypothetical protein